MTRIYSVIILYLVLTTFIVLIKPAMIFDASGKLKHFNYDENDASSSLLNIEVILSVLAVFCYYVVIAKEMLY
jgi:hypothetical protein